MHNVPKWSDTLLKSCSNVSDHYGILCIKGLRECMHFFFSSNPSIFVNQESNILTTIRYYQIYNIKKEAVF